MSIAATESRQTLFKHDLLIHVNKRNKNYVWWSGFWYIRSLCWTLHLLSTNLYLKTWRAILVVSVAGWQVYLTDVLHFVASERAKSWVEQSMERSIVAVFSYLHLDELGWFPAIDMGEIWSSINQNPWRVGFKWTWVFCCSLRYYYSLICILTNWFIYISK